MNGQVPGIPTWQPYCGDAPSPAGWLLQWNFDPLLIGIMALLLALGLRRFPATARSQIALLAGMLILFVTPFCALGSALFVARSVHHLALILVLAPLLVKAVGPRAFGGLSVAAATVVQTAILWAWHVPALYDRALSSSFVFWIMQLSILLSAAAWWASLRNAAALEATAGLLAQMVQMGLLGALLVFTGRAVYAPHWLTTSAWALTPLEDQQIAGLVMWVVGGGAYLAIASAMLWRTLGPASQPRAA